MNFKEIDILKEMNILLQIWCQFEFQKHIYYSLRIVSIR